jgi:hypothetical protein
MNKEKKEKEEGLGVPPLGSGYPLQFLTRLRDPIVCGVGEMVGFGV